MSFRSGAETVRYHLSQILNDEQEHTIPELFDYVMSNTTQDSINRATFNAALKSLVDTSNGEYAAIRRGIYKKISSPICAVGYTSPQYSTENEVDPVEAYKTEISKILDEAILKIKTAYKGDIFGVTSDQLEAIRSIGIRILDGLSSLKED